MTRVQGHAPLSEFLRYEIYKIPKDYLSVFL